MTPLCWTRRLLHKNRGALAGAMRGIQGHQPACDAAASSGGVLYTASCSFHLSKALFLDMLQDAASDSGRRMVLREITGQPVDHPEILTIPETGYIKGALLEAAD